MKPSPTSDSATARLIEAPNAKAVPKAPSRKASIASGTYLPLAAISSRPIAIEPTTAMNGIDMPRQAAAIGSAERERWSCDLARHQGADGAAFAHRRPAARPTSRPR